MTDICKTCRAPIVWAKTPTGKTMPIDAESKRDGNVILIDGPEGKLAVVVHATTLPATRRYTSHFATCPNAADHRGARA